MYLLEKTPNQILNSIYFLEIGQIFGIIIISPSPLYWKFTLTAWGSLEKMQGDTNKPVNHPDSRSVLTCISIGGQIKKKKETILPTTNNYSHFNVFVNSSYSPG